MCSANPESTIYIHSSGVSKMIENAVLEENFTNESLSEMYTKVVSEANIFQHKKGFIKCSQCGEEILMIPTLRKMNEAIENHVKIHKASSEEDFFLKQNTAMHVRLDLVHQVLQEASDSFRLF